jgi:hypothetical protein
MRIVKALPGVYESIIVACKEMDLFELPGAIGEFERDRFVFANDSFLGVIGLNRSDISGVALSPNTPPPKFTFFGVRRS